MQCQINSHLKTVLMRRSFNTVSKILALTLAFFACSLVIGVHASAQAWSLTNDQRRAYLNYYAPVILKRGDENDNKQGRDWITNYDFDQDGNFATNRVNWLKMPQYISASTSGPSAYDRWRIRPTLYTALVEYMEGGSKSVMLLYHIYNAADKDGSGIHDWERVEISVRGVTGTPGSSGEYVNHVAATMHKEQLVRRYYDAGGLNFMHTATGKHILIWQADESDFDLYIGGEAYGYHGHALWHVKTPYSTIATQMNSLSDAKVALPESDNKNVHYVFVPEGSQAAVDTWGAKPLAYTTASNLASRVDNGTTVRWYQTKRITYELQDIADILPTHAQSNAWTTHWLSRSYLDVLLESPIINEAGQAETLTGLQRFFVFSRDTGKSDQVGADEAFMYKKAFMGTYSAELNSEITFNPIPDVGGDVFPAFEGIGVDDYGRSRGAASGYLNSHNSFWWQHDFFAHPGTITSGSTNYEGGTWLAGPWYTAANGGFDGRWVQLFADRAGVEPTTLLNLSMVYPTNRCSDRFYVTAKATGGQSPYTFTWTNATPQSAPWEPNNSAEVYAYMLAAVTVTSADGQARSTSFKITPQCSGGTVLP